MLQDSTEAGAATMRMQAILRRLSRLEQRLKPAIQTEAGRYLMERLAAAKRRMVLLGYEEPGKWARELRLDREVGGRLLTPVEILNAGRARAAAAARAEDLTRQQETGGCDSSLQAGSDVREE